MAASARFVAGEPFDPSEGIELRNVPSATPSGIWLNDTGPSAEHSDARLGLAAALREHFHRPAGSPEAPGGWWILGQVELDLEDAEVVRPDLAGWRRERLPEPPADQETATDAVDGPIDPVLRVGDQGPTNRGGR